MDNKLDVMPLMTDQMKAVVRKQKELVEDAFATDVGYDEMRANYIKERRFWNEGGPVMSSTEEMALEGPAGPFRVRLYRPTSAVEARPAMDEGALRPRVRQDPSSGGARRARARGPQRHAHGHLRGARPLRRPDLRAL